jgi:hypothetical protein
MPYPHKNFSDQFRRELKLRLDKERTQAKRKQIWCLILFDQYASSMRSFHSLDGSYGILYKTLLGAIRSSDADAGYDANSQLTHEIVDELYSSWVKSVPPPRQVCIYMKYSPCKDGKDKAMNGKNYPDGCMRKLVQFALEWRGVFLHFCVYFDEFFNKPTQNADMADFHKFASNAESLSLCQTPVSLRGSA